MLITKQIYPVLLWHSSLVYFQSQSSRMFISDLKTAWPTIKQETGNRSFSRILNCQMKINNFRRSGIRDPCTTTSWSSWRATTSCGSTTSTTSTRETSKQTRFEKAALHHSHRCTRLNIQGGGIALIFAETLVGSRPLAQYCQGCPYFGSYSYCMFISKFFKKKFWRFVFRPPSHIPCAHLYDHSLTIN
jgi:hypothetical protein